jgi:hypothetical protein
VVHALPRRRHRNAGDDPTHWTRWWP